MTDTASDQQVYASNRLAGLAFHANGRWCYFRTSRGFKFDATLDDQHSYALVDPENESIVGVLVARHDGSINVPEFRVFFLRPLLD